MNASLINAEGANGNKTTCLSSVEASVVVVVCVVKGGWGRDFIHRSPSI